MWWPRLANPRAPRFRFDRLTPTALTKLAWSPSYRAPRAADLHDPNTFRPPVLPQLSANERRLLDAILADPDADASRLAYADWAERQGNHARARFIRAQIEEAHYEDRGERTGESGQAQTGGGNGNSIVPGRGCVIHRCGFSSPPPLWGRSPRSRRGGGQAFRVDQAAPPPGSQSLADLPHNGGGERHGLPVNPNRGLLPSADHLLQSVTDASGSLAALFAPWGATDFVFRRGFVEGMSLSGRAFLSNGDSLFRMTPLREVRLVAVQPFAGELARCEHLTRLRRLDLTGNRIGPVGMRELAESAFLGGLKELGLSGNDLGADGAAALRAAKWLPGLKGLELADNRLGPTDLEPLLSLTSHDLTNLDLSRNPLGVAGGDILARSSLLPHLRRLRVAHCQLGAEGAASLFGARRFEDLRELDVRLNDLGPEGAVALAADESLANLLTLDLGFNDLGDDGVASLSSATHFSRLVTLNLAANRLTAAGAAALAESDVFSAAESLNLTANPLGDAGAIALVRKEGLSNVRHLNLSNCGITDVGLLGLVATGALGGLKSLSLAWNPLGQEGVKALAACPDLAGLRELDLTGTQLGFAGAVALAESKHLLSLRSLILGSHERLPPDAVGLLESQFGTIIS